MNKIIWKNAITNPPPREDGYEYLCYCDKGCYWLCEYSLDGWIQLGSSAQPGKVMKYADFPRLDTKNIDK